jgi:16S rRNA (cytosine967-C5)-methyltransferase
MKTREAAYLALLASLRQEGFILHTLEKWQTIHHPSPADFAFAQEIAFGSARLALSLDYLAAQLSSQGKLSLKLKEKALLRTALYQYLFMSKVPIYAIVNETIEVAKKHCHSTFVNFLNALLRKLADSNLSSASLPQGTSPEELSIRYSYPISFVDALIAQYGLNPTLSILEAGNAVPQTMVRLRSKEMMKTLDPALHPLPDTNSLMALVSPKASLSTITTSPHYYIQNSTPATLVNGLAKLTTHPKTILDLCASPGGKLLAAHDQFPEAELFANDISQEKIDKLSQNITKYDLSVTLSCGLGENYTSNSLFDLIILDVPCSNSGVLNKRPEARWRLNPEALQELEKKQLDLLKHASKFLAPGGCIWYMTCSILKEENEWLIEQFCKSTGMKCLFTKTCLPNLSGGDGGFGCLLTY